MSGGGSGVDVDKQAGMWEEEMNLDWRRMGEKLEPTSTSALSLPTSIYTDLWGVWVLLHFQHPNPNFSFDQI